MIRGKRKIKSYEVTQKGRTLLISVKSHFKLPIKNIILGLLSSEGMK